MCNISWRITHAWHCMKCQPFIMFMKHTWEVAFRQKLTCLRNCYTLVSTIRNHAIVKKTFMAQLLPSKPSSKLNKAKRLEPLKRTPNIPVAVSPSFFRFSLQTSSLVLHQVLDHNLAAPPAMPSVLFSTASKPTTTRPNFTLKSHIYS